MRLLLLSVAMLAACDTGKDADTGAETGEEREELKMMFVYTEDGRSTLESKKPHHTMQSWAARMSKRFNAVIDVSGLPSDEYIASPGDYVYLIRDDSDTDLIGSSSLGDNRYAEMRKTIRKIRAVQEYRDEDDHDLVIGLAGRFREADGVGNANLTRGGMRSDWKDAYTALMAGDASVVIHEVGHLLGAHHDNHNDDEPCRGPNSDFACGAVVSGSFDVPEDPGSDDLNCQNKVTTLTTMSYRVNPPANWEPVFSNPNIVLEDSDGNEVVLGSESEYNICIIASMWDYATAFSDFVDGDSYFRADLPSGECDETYDSVEYETKQLPQLYNWSSCAE